VKLCYEDGIVIDSASKSSDHYFVNFCSYDAGSAYFNIKAYIAIKDSLHNYTYVNTFPLYDKNESMSKDSQMTTGFSFKTNKNYVDLYLFLKGTYKNLDGSKEFSVNIVHLYSPKTKTVSVLKGQAKNTVINFLRNKIKE
jgi:hypothetical protein